MRLVQAVTRRAAIIRGCVIAASLSWIQCQAPATRPVRVASLEESVRTCLTGRTWLPRHDKALLLDAISACRTALADNLDPQVRAEVNAALGKALWSGGRQEEGIAPLREALRESDLVETRLVLGESLVAVGMGIRDDGLLREAESHFRDAIHREPRNARAYERLGETCWILEKYADAIDAYRESARLDPGDGTKQFRLARRMNQIGRYEESVETFEAAKALAPEMATDRMNIDVLSASRRGERWPGWDDKTPLAH